MNKLFQKWLELLDAKCYWFWYINLFLGCDMVQKDVDITETNK